jgi:hypothetical protein
LQKFKSIVWSPRAVAAAILGLGGVATYIINFPGSMEDDSFVQLLEGRSESYSFWHPPVMSWMLGVSDSLIGPAAAWFVLFDMVLAFGALMAVLWLTRRVSWWAAACAGAILFLPQLILLQAVVWKDALFANACVAGFVCLGLAAEHWRRERLRIGMLFGCAALFALAALTRQNGLVVLPCAVAGLAIIAARQEKSWRLGAGYAAVLLLVAGGLALGANALLELRWDGTPSREAQIKILRLYDITGMAKRNPAITLESLERDAPRLRRVVFDEAVRRWSPVKNDTLEYSPRIVATLDATPSYALWNQWFELVKTYPGTYLAVRGELFLWVFQAPDVGQCHPFHVGDQGEAADLKELGLRPRLDARDLALWHYGDFFEYTPVFWHSAYAAIGLFVFVVAARRRRPADIAVASMLAAVMTFTATFFVISIACDYRYLYVVDLSALAGVLYLAADWPLGRKKGGPKAPLKENSDAPVSARD